MATAEGADREGAVTRSVSEEAEVCTCSVIEEGSGGVPSRSGERTEDRPQSPSQGRDQGYRLHILDWKPNFECR